MKKLLLIAPIIMFSMSQCKKDNTENPVVPNTNIINAIGIDKLGNKWFATPAGLMRYNNSTWLTFKLPITNQQVNSLSLRNDTIMLATLEGSIMVKIVGDSLLTLNQYNASLTPLISNTVNVSGIDPYSNIWFGTFLGVSFLHGNEWASNSDVHFSLTTENNNISCIAFRHNDFFLGTYGKSLWHVYFDAGIDAVSGASQMLKNLNGKLTSDTIFSLFAGSDTSIWIGSKSGLTKNKGVTKQGTGEFDYYLEGERIHSILESADGRIWAGTENGLFVMDGLVWTKYTTADNLVNNFVLSLAEDAQGGIWIGTQNGISEFKNGTFVNYTLQ
jgi:ligand-binding sensor domain-containing protein